MQLLFLKVNPVRGLRWLGLSTWIPHDQRADWVPGMQEQQPCSGRQPKPASFGLSLEHKMAWFVTIDDLLQDKQGSSCVFVPHFYRWLPESGHFTGSERHGPQLVATSTEPESGLIRKRSAKEPKRVSITCIRWAVEELWDERYLWNKGWA